jgi:hypothetical protein
MQTSPTHSGRALNLLGCNAIFAIVTLIQLYYSSIAHPQGLPAESAESQSMSANDEADVAWELLPDQTDIVALDDFISTYPKSTASDTALAIRYARTPITYESLLDFLDRYPDRWLSTIVLQDLLGLCIEQRDVGLLLEIPTRFPATPQAHVANLHIQALLLSALSESQRIVSDTTQTDEEYLAQCRELIAQYDVFLRLYPDSPHADLLEATTEKLFIDYESKYLMSDVFAERMQRKPALNRTPADYRAQMLVTRYAEILNEDPPAESDESDSICTNYNALSKNDPDGAIALLQYRGIVLRRIEAAINILYEGSGAAGDLAAIKTTERAYESLTRQIQELKQAQELGFATVIGAIRQVGQELHEAIDASSEASLEAFSRLEKSQADLAVQLQTINAKADSLVASVGRMESQLDGIRGTLTEMRDALTSFVDTFDLRIENFDRQLSRIEKDTATKVRAVRKHVRRTTRSSIALPPWLPRPVGDVIRTIDADIRDFPVPKELPRWPVPRDCPPMIKNVSRTVNHWRTEQNRIVRHWKRVMETVTSEATEQLNPDRIVSTFRDKIEHADLVLLRLAYRAGPSAWISKPSPTILNPDEKYSGTPVYFVNGVWTSQSEAEKHSVALANHLKRPVALIYNKHLSDSEDLLEAIYDRTWPVIMHADLRQRTPAAKQIAHIVVNSKDPVTIISHSQGCLQVRNALLIAGIAHREAFIAKRVKWAAMAPPMHRSEIIFRPTGHNYHERINPDDLVAEKIGLRRFWSNPEIGPHRFNNYIEHIPISFPFE